MAKFKIVAQGRPNLTGDFTFEMEGLQGVDVQLMEANAMSDEEFLETAKDADALIVRGMPVREKVINGLKKCKIIALGSVGTDHSRRSGGHRQRHPCNQLPRYLHPGGCRAHRGANLGSLPTAPAHGQDGPGAALVGGASNLIPAAPAVRADPGV